MGMIEWARDNTGELITETDRLAKVEDDVNQWPGHRASVQIAQHVVICEIPEWN